MKYLLILLISFLLTNCATKLDCDNKVRELYPNSNIEFIFNDDEFVIYKTDNSYLKCLKGLNTEISKLKSIKIQKEK